MGMVRIFTWNPVMTSIFEGLFTPNTRPFETKTRVVRVPGTYMNTLFLWNQLGGKYTRFSHGNPSWVLMPFILHTWFLSEISGRISFYGHFKKNTKCDHLDTGQLHPRKIQCFAK